MVVHNLKLAGVLFDAIRREGRAALPVYGKKTADIAVGHIIEFLSLRDRQDKLRVSVEAKEIVSDMEAILTVRLVKGWKSKDVIHTSRYLSLILRHKPEVIGLTLDKHGWADVSALIEGISRTHFLTMPLLEEIVRTDEKGRYAFNGDRTKIRANQGHSVAVDVELTESPPPDVLWHGTGEKYLQSILSQGLLPQSRLYVHLSADPATAKTVGSRHGRPVILRVDTAQMREDGYVFYRSANGVWLTKCVPVRYLTVWW